MHKHSDPRVSYSITNAEITITIINGNYMANIEQECKQNGR